MWLILNGIFNIRLNVEFEKNGNILGLWLIYYFDFNSLECLFIYIKFFLVIVMNFLYIFIEVIEFWFYMYF